MPSEAWNRPSQGNTPPEKMSHEDGSLVTDDRLHSKALQARLPRKCSPWTGLTNTQGKTLWFILGWTLTNASSAAKVSARGGILFYFSEFYWHEELSAMPMEKPSARAPTSFSTTSFTLGRAIKVCGVGERLQTQVIPHVALSDSHWRKALWVHWVSKGLHWPLCFHSP